MILYRLYLFLPRRTIMKQQMAQRRPAIGGNNACPSNLIIHIFVRLLAWTKLHNHSVLLTFDAYDLKFTYFEVLWRNRYSTASFRVHIMLPRSHTCTWRYIRISCCVAILACGRSGLWPFRFVAVSVCGRFGLWPFRSVAVSICGRFGLWPFRFVAVSVCGLFGLWPFRLWPFWFVAVMTCYPIYYLVVCVQLTRVFCFRCDEIYD